MNYRQPTSLVFRLVPSVALLSLLAGFSALATEPPAIVKAARIDRAAKKLPASFSPAPPESFFWALPGAEDEPKGPVLTVEEIAGTYGFRLALKAQVTPGMPCEWKLSAEPGSKDVVIEGSAPSSSNLICLAFTRKTRPTVMNNPQGERINVKENYEKAISLRVEGASVDSGKGVRIVLTRADAADATRLAKGGLAAVAVFDVNGKPDFGMTEEKPTVADGIWTRRNDYRISGGKAEIWLYDRLSKEILLKKALEP